MSHPFSTEQLAAFLLGRADPQDRAAIQQALPGDPQLQIEVLLLEAMLAEALPAGSDVVETPLPTGDSETLHAGNEETLAAASHKAPSAELLPAELREIAELQRQGLSVEQIAAQLGATRTLVMMKLEKLASLERSQDD